MGLEKGVRAVLDVEEEEACCKMAGQCASGGDVCLFGWPRKQAGGVCV